MPMNGRDPMHDALTRIMARIPAGVTKYRLIHMAPWSREIFVAMYDSIFRLDGFLNEQACFNDQ